MAGYVEDGHIETTFLYAFMILEDINFIISIVYFLWGRGGQCSGLTTLPHSYADCLEIWNPQLPGTLRVRPALYRDCFTFIFTVLFLIVTFLVGATMSLSV